MPSLSLLRLSPTRLLSSSLSSRSSRICLFSASLQTSAASSKRPLLRPFPSSPFSAASCRVCSRGKRAESGQHPRRTKPAFIIRSSSLLLLRSLLSFFHSFASFTISVVFEAPVVGIAALLLTVFLFVWFSRRHCLLFLCKQCVQSALLPGKEGATQPQRSRSSRVLLRSSRRIIRITSSVDGSNWMK